MDDSKQEIILKRLDSLERRIEALEQATGSKIGTSAEDDLPIDLSLDSVEEQVEQGETVQLDRVSGPNGTEVPGGVVEPETILSEDFDTTETKAPSISINDSKSQEAKKAIMDVRADKYAWRNDVAGSHVNNIISAISLNDRVLFINTLFEQDPVLFQSNITALNSLATFAEAEDYVIRKFPNWNLGSTVVYRFMMAVRRRFS